ncbi:hypothetical protein [Ruminococcus albus]|uniref:Right handed beta helix domain-containing protein n=1 Tax=Ruminococcus albus TaxID=1264 RepID=A0A1H7GD98_RUMAL|nr:hypothetical protein [Ruminococcus albus]SEK36246.1 hypothetical protein SAMN05216469_10267 [Ruminococcus albus]
MKRTVIWVALLALVISATGCGKISGGKESSAKEKNESSTVENFAESGSDSEAESLAESKAENGSRKKKPAHAEIGANGAKAVTDVLLIPHEEIDISRKVDFADMYGRHVLHTGVVGLVGAPVEVNFDTAEVKGGQLVFVYDPNELKGVRPDALMFMWYDEDNDNYVELEDGVLNTDNCSMSINIDKPGVYLLVNKYQWYNAWGAKLDDNGLASGYDPTSGPISSEVWEMNENTGDILKLKDDDYIAKSRKEDGYAYEFFVSTPEELASAVFVNNCADPRPDSISINILNDIDLDGYEWAPMGWYTAGIDFDFTGIIYGGGHTIKNMHISDGYHVGFIGYATDCTVGALNFENAYVSGRDVGILAGYPRNCFFADCSVQGETDGYMDVGTMIGDDQSNIINNCKADVTVCGKQVTDYLSFTDMKEADPGTE